MLELWTGVLGHQMIDRHAAEHAKTAAAHGRMHRKQIDQPDADPGENDDMGTQTILGDVTNPTPIVIAGNQSSGGDLLKTLAIAALGAAVPTAGLIGVAGYHLLNQQQPTPIIQPVVPDPESPDFSVGLGKIEDYLKQ